MEFNLSNVNIDTNKPGQGAEGNYDGLPVETTTRDRARRKIAAPKRYDDEFNPTIERLKRKFERRKNQISRLVNNANELIEIRGSRRTLKGLIDKLEEALKDLELAADDYASHISNRDELMKIMDYVEISSDGVIYCLENIETHLSERINETRSSASSLSSISTARSATTRLSQPIMISENIDEQNRITELEREVQFLRRSISECQRSLQDPESLINRMRDFDDDNRSRNDHQLDKDLDEIAERSGKRNEQQYDVDPNEIAEQSGKRNEQQYDVDPDEIAERSGKRNEQQYDVDPDEIAQLSGKRNEQQYDVDPDEIAERSGKRNEQQYDVDPEEITEGKRPPQTGQRRPPNTGQRNDHQYDEDPDEIAEGKRPPQTGQRCPPNTGQRNDHQYDEDPDEIAEGKRPLQTGQRRPPNTDQRNDHQYDEDPDETDEQACSRQNDRRNEQLYVKGTSQVPPCSLRNERQYGESRTLPVSYRYEQPSQGRRLYADSPSPKTCFQSKESTPVEQIEVNRNGRHQRTDYDTPLRASLRAQERLSVSWVKNYCDNEVRQRSYANETNPVFANTLPRLQLPRFAGDPLEWPAFISLFKCLVHDQPITDTQRMTHLQRTLDGDAKKLISGMLNHGHMYKTALTELEEHFGNEEAVARAYLRTIFDHPRVTDDNFLALRSFYNTLHVAVSTLNNLNYSNDLAATDNLRRAVGKLPESLKQQWGERKVEMMPRRSTLVDFDEWLRARVRAKAAVADNPTRGQARTNASGRLNQPAASKGRSNANVYQPRASLLTTNVNKRNASSAEEPKTTVPTSNASPSNRQSKDTKTYNSEECPVCQQKHSIEKCERFKSMSVNERAKLAKEKTLCFFCLKSTEHIARFCKRTTRCDVGDCNKRHHPLLHGADPVFAGTSSVSYGDATTLLQIVPIVVKTYNTTTHTYALLDSGSQATLVCEDFADKVKMDGESTVLHLSTITSKDKECPSKKVSFVVSGTTTNATDIKVDEAWTVPQLNLPRQRVTKGTLKNCPHLAGIDIPAVDSKDVTILLGANVIEAIVQREVRLGQPGQPAAILTAFGWTLAGSIKSFINPESLHVMHVHRVLSTDETLEKRVEEWWRTDSFGTKYDYKASRTREDKQAIDILEKTVKHVNGRYEAGMLWRDDNVKLPNNRVMAENRLKSTEKRLKRDDDLAKKYCAIIEDYVNKGYARVLSSEESEALTAKQWFLPHHPVLNPHKPGKVRMVMDAAAQYEGASLNDKLLIGPDLLNSLVGVLLRFREHKVGISADIEAMFHQCRIIEEDQPALRFLWRNLELQRPPDVYQMQVMIFGAASSPCTATYVLRKTADDNKHDESFSDEAINTVHKNFYVDDMLKSVPTEEEAIRLQQEITKLLSRGGFRLTKWSSSSRNVLATIPQQERAGSINLEDLTNEEMPVERTLGLSWNTETDGFQVSVSSPKPCDITKRGVLSRLSTVFDPLGMLLPFTLPAKCLIQNLWQKKTGWDDPLDESDHRSWTSWLHDLPLLRDVELPRCLFSNTCSGTVMELHVFADASEKGFGAVCYARFVRPDGHIHVSFVMARNRVAPLKQLSIPRLELQAAVLAVRLNDTVKKELTLDVEDTTFWSDSSTVLKYIKNESRRFHTFVANRVSEIQDLSCPEQWRHVPGKLNPADDCTRGLRASEFSKRCRWLNGPPFLWQPPEQWPKEEPIESTLSNDDKEVKSQKWTGVVSAPQPVQFPVDAEKYSSWTKYRRVIAWICRFVRNCRRKPLDRVTGPLTVAEIKQAEQLAIKTSQREAYESEFHALAANKPIPISSRLHPLRPYVDKEGFLKVGGRLRKAPVTDSVRHPIILSPKHEVTRLIVMYYHHQLYCPSDKQLLNELRQTYWITKGLSTVHRLSNTCSICRRRKASPSPPVMADLPEPRLGYHSPPFTHTGVDYFGPLLVRHGRKTEKRYGALFTCLTTRAVHIEIAHSLETDAYLMAMRRMMARRGRPTHIWSDNGTNFVGAEKELRDGLKRLNTEQICDQLSSDGVQWHFNPPSSPHFGGAWERLVQSAKRALKVVAGKQRVNDETLLTFMAEVESLMNGRPLTHVSVDPRDEEALTPNHFLLGRASPNLPQDVLDDRDLYSRKHWKHAQVMTDHFWKRWLREYLPSLTERRKWTRDVPNLCEGDIVLIADENQPRGRWPVGRVIRPILGDDGVVRSAEVKTSSGTYTRPVVKLCILESKNK